MRVLRALASGLAVPCVIAALTLAGPAAAAADPESYPVPAGGVLQLTGHGWGHGHGMSQWAAQGAAEQGVATQAMLDAFYPGTGTATLPARAIRVHLTGGDGPALTVWPADGLAVTDLAGGRADATAGTPTPLPAGPAYQQWRTVRSGSGFALQSYDGQAWAPYSAAGTLAGPVRFADGAGVVRVAMAAGSSRDYRGSVSALASGASAVTVVGVVALEDYLRGVVPRESPSSWLPAALQAQAIAARSYATYSADHAASTAAFDICDSDNCQAYGGKHFYPASGSPGGDYELETSSTDAAVAATAGQVRTWQGAAIFAQFSSSDGGWTAAGSQPYLTAHADPWDGVDPHNGGHTWTATISAADIQRAYPAVGTLTALDVTGRDGNGEWGGRVQMVVLHGVDASGAATSVTATGYGIARAHSWPASSDGLRSEWWTVTGVGTGGPVTVPPAAPGLVPLPARVLAVTAGAGLRAGQPRTFSLDRFLPAGATAAVLAVDARGGPGTAGGAMLAAAPTGRMAQAVPLAVVLPSRPTAGTTLVRLGTGRAVSLTLSRGAAGLRLRLLAAVAPGGLVPVGTSPGGLLGFHASPAPVQVLAGGARLAPADAGTAMRLAFPVGTTGRLSRGTVAVRLPWRPPAAIRGVLVSVTSASLPSGMLRVWPVTAPRSAVAVRADRSGVATVLAFLPTRDGRLALRGPAGGSFTVTLVAWL